MSTPGSLSINDIAHAEGTGSNTTYTFTVNRTGGSSGAVNVDWAVSFPGGAGIANVADFTGTTSGTLNFANGETSKTITVTVAGDTDFEPDETFNILLSNATGGATISDATGVGTITNDDAAQPGTLSIDDVGHLEGDGGATLYTFTVTRADGSDGAVSATWTLNAPGGASYADGGDFAGGQPMTGTVSFADGQTTATIEILVQGDTVSEDVEDFTITLSAPTGGATLADDTGLGTIVDDDVPNLAPVVDLNGADDGIDYAVSFTEGGVEVPIGAADLIVTDDLDQIVSATITITNPEDGDELLYGSTLPDGIEAAFSNNGTVLTFTATNGAVTAADMAAAIATVLFWNELPDIVAGTRSLSVTVSDGVSSSAPAYTVVTVNDADSDTPPAGQDNSIIGAEDTPYVFTLADFPFFDADGDTLTHVRIATLPALGTLYVNGIAVAEEESVAVEDIIDGVFTYLPAANGNGLDYAGFTFQVVVTGGVADPTPNVLTINLTSQPDPAAIGGTDTGAVTEDGTTSASGALTVSDPDDGEESFQTQSNAATAYGSFSIDAAGNWSYQLDNGNAAVQALNDGETLTDSIQVLSFDGTAHAVVITINGESEPVPPITLDLDSNAPGYDYAGAFTEQGAAAAIGSGISIATQSGSVSSLIVQLTDGTVGDLLTYDPGTVPGGFIVNVSATQIAIFGIGSAAQYEAMLASIRFVNNTDNPTLNGNTDRVISVVVGDHISGQNSPTAYAVIAITAVNDLPTIGGQAAGDIYEDATFSTSGQLTISDPDQNESRFQADSLSGSYGSFNISQSGAWTYTANFNQFMRGGHDYLDTFRVWSFDNSSYVDVVVTSHGNDDAPNIFISGGNTVGYVYEDGSLTDGHTVPILDPDENESGWVSGDFTTAYGTFHIETNGTWTYTLNNDAPALLTLNSGQHVTDTHLMTSLGGNQITLQVQVNGANEPLGPPVLLNPIADAHVLEDNAVSYQVPADAFFDPDNAITYSATLAGGGALPGWLSFDAGTRTFSGTPPLNYAGTLSIRVTASDGTGSAYDDFDLVIDPVNDAPTVSILPPTLFPAGGEAQVNTTLAGDQRTPGVAALSNGDFLVVWTGAGTGDTFGIFLQRYDAAGNAVGVETPINSTTADNQISPSVAALADGGYVVTWASLNQDGNLYGIYSRRYDAAGNAVTGEVLVNSYVTGSQTDPSVSALPNGGYVITWTGPGTGGTGVYGQRYDAAGVADGGQFLVATSTNIYGSDVAVSPGGGFAVSYYSFSSSYVAGIRFYDAAGTALGSVVSLGSSSSSPQPAVVALTGGGYVVVWGGASGIGDLDGIAMRRFDALGNSLGAATRVNVTTDGTQFGPEIAALPDGGFLVTWMSYDQVGGQYDIYARRFDAAGNAVTGEFLVNTVPAGDQQFPVVAVNGSGGLIVAWESNGGDGAGFAVRAQIGSLPAAVGAVEQVVHDLRGWVVVDDVDAGTGTITVTLSVDYGILNASAGATGVGLAGQGSASLVVTGTLAQVRAFLSSASSGTLSYLASTDAPPASTQLSVTVDDGGNSGSGGPLSATASGTIAITAVNDAPTAEAGPGVTTGAGQPIALTGLAVSDVDATGDITVQLSVAHGALTIRTDVAGGITAADIVSGANGSSTLFLRATPAEINATLAASGGLTYQGNAGFTGTDTLDLRVSEATNATAVGFSSLANPATSSPHGIAVGDLNGDGRDDIIAANVTTGTASVMLANATGFNSPVIYTGASAVIDVTIADIDNDGDLDFGIVSLGAGLTVYLNQGSGTFLASGTVSASVGNAAVFDDFNNDGNLDVAIVTRTAQIVVRFGNGFGSFSGGDVYTMASNGWDIASGDFNGDGYTDLIATAGGPLGGGSVSLYLGSATGAFGAPSTLLSANGAWAVVAADFNADGKLDFAVTGTAGVLVKLGNGDGTFMSTQTYAIGGTAGGLAAADFNGDGILDLAAGLVNGGASILLGNGDGSFQNGTSVPVAGVSLAAGDFDADGDLDLAGSTYDGSNVNVVRNGSTVLSAGDSASIQVNGFNTPPSGTDATIAINEDMPRVLAEADFGFNDGAQGDTFAGVVITTVPGAGTLTLNGGAVTAGQFVSAADIAAGLLVFTPAPDANGVGYAGFTFQVRDDGGTDNGGVDTDQSPNTLTFDVNAVNDAPTVTGMANNVATFLEGGTEVYLDVGQDAVLADVDSSSFDGGSLHVDFPGGGGATEFLSFTVGGRISIFGNDVVVDGQPIGTFSGGNQGNALHFNFTALATPAHVQVLLQHITYYNNGANPGPATQTVRFTLIDADGTANGGQDTLTFSTTVNIFAVNDAPGGTDATLTMLEDGTYVFATGDFGFTDPDDSPPGDLLAVMITTLPTAGTLRLNNVAVTAGQFVSVADINAGLLTFQPAADGNGAGYASFTFQVQDDDGIALGGVDLDQSPNTITFDVTPVNDAAVITGDTIGSVTEGGGTANATGGVQVATGDLNAADVDDPADSWQPDARATTYGSFSIDASGHWTFTLDDNNAAVQALRAGQSLTDSFVVYTEDNTPQTVIITVNGQNDAPVNVVPGPITGDEDRPINLNGVSIGDVDGLPGDTYTVTLSVAHGTLNIRTDVAGGITGANIIGGGNGTNGLTITGTLAQINATLQTANALTYLGDPNYNGSDGLRVATWEGVPSDAASLTASSPITTGNGPVHLITADVNGDGLLDLVYTVGGSTSQAAYRLGNGNGTFGAETTLSGGNNVTSVAVGDVDGDGRGDIVVANYAGAVGGAGSAGVCYGAVGGGFGPIQSLGSISQAYDVIIADMNGDGRADIIVDRRDTGQSYVILQTGTPRSFSAPAAYSNTPGNYTKSIVTGDFNNDGIADLVAVNPGSSATGNPPGSVTIRFGTGNGTLGTLFNVANSASTNIRYWEAAAADVNNDGNLDLVVTSLVDFQGFTVFMGDGTGNFASGIQYSTGANTTSIQMRDLNGDGILDAVFTTQGNPGATGWRLGNGNGTFQAAVTLPGGFNPESVAVGDFDGDGDMDFASVAQSDNSLRIFTNNATSLGDTDIVAITVNPVNDAPTVANLNGDTVTFIEGSAAELRLDLSQDADLSDIDSANFDGGTMSVTIAGAQAYEYLSFVVGGRISFVFDSIIVDGVLVGSFSGGAGGGPLNFAFGPNATPDRVEAILQALSYFNTNNDNPLSGARAITITINDGDGTANGGADTLTINTTVNMVAVNDAPTATGLVGDSAVYTEGDAAVLLDSGSNAALADVDSFNFAGGSLRVALASGYIGIEDQFFIDTSGVVTIAAGQISVNGVYIGDFFSSGDGFLVAFNANANAANVQLLMHAVSYRNLNADNPTASTRNIVWTLNDGDGTANGGADTLTVTTSLTVLPVNDAPSGTDNIVTVAEDSPYIFAAADFGFSDPAEGNGFLSVIISTLPTNGTLTWLGNAVMPGQFIPLASLGDLMFTPGANANGNGYASFTFQVRDNGGTANGGVDTDQTPNTLTINVTAVNDGPVLTGLDGTPTYTEDGPFVVLDGNATLFDVELAASGNYAGATLTVSRAGGANADDRYDFVGGDVSYTGSMILGGIISNLGGLHMIGNATRDGGTFTVTFNASATQADVNAVLQQLAYQNINPNPSGPITLDYVFSDGNSGGGQGSGGVGTATGSITVAIQNVNDAPSLDQSKSPVLATVNEDAVAPVGAVGTLVSSLVDYASVPGGLDNVGDIDTGALLGIAIIGVGAAFGTLYYSTDNGANWTAVGAVSDASALLLAADGNTRLYFQPLPDLNGTLVDALTFRVWDQTSGTAGTYANASVNGGTTAFSLDFDTVSLQVNAVNDAPALDASKSPVLVAINEDAGLPAGAVGTLVSGLVDLTPPGNGLANVSDADGGTPLGIAITGIAAGGTLYYSTDGGANWTQLVSASDSSALLLAADADTRIYFVPAANFNGTVANAITFRAWDQTSGTAGALANVTVNGGTTAFSSATDTAALVVNSVNDAPSGTDAAFTINEDTSYSFTAASFGFSDAIDGDAFAGVVITTVPVPGILLFDADGPGGAAATAVTAGQFISAADIALGRLTFNPAANANGAPFSSFTFQVRDSGGTANGGQDTDQSPNTITFNVTAVNDAPVNNLPGGSLVMLEDGTAILTGISAISVSDLEATTLTVTLSVSHGVLTLSGTAGLMFVGGANGTATMTVTGTAAAINTALNGMTYTPTANYNGADALQVQTTDNGQTGAGGVLTDSDTLPITIIAVNDAPQGTNGTVTGSEDDPVVFTATDFGFSDPVDGGAHSLLAVKVTTLPGVGTLYLDSDGPGGAAPVAVTAGQFISAAEIAAGHFYYLGAADGFGSPYASFTFQVQDNGGTANGGVDLDPTPNTITINLVADNMPPVVDLNGGGAGIDYATSFTEDGPAVAIGSGVIVSDPDSGIGDLIESATITLIDRVAGDALVLGMPLGGFSIATISSAGAITIQITGTGTAAQYQQMIQSITYATTNQDPTVGGTDMSRTITVTVGDGAANSAVATATISINAVDDASVAQPDAFTITESGTITNGNLFANNGAGADSDPDGPALTISAVNGSGANVGGQITLASGALLTVNANGTFSYDPNGAFLPTPTSGSGASNTPAHDSFTYTLAGGNTVTVSITLTGLDTDDVLRGTAGTDVLSGGLGNDTYYVENTADQVLETAGQGNDRIVTSVSYAIAAGSSVETLEAAAGTAALALVGNEIANTLIGNAGANILSGGGGADVMIGHGGNDTYYVDNAGDVVTEAVGEGFDALYTSVSYVLAAGSEVEWFSTAANGATDPLNLTGNGLAQYIIGNAGANVISGGGGGDILRGLGGNDTYIITDAAAVTQEQAGGGFDAIYTTGSYALANGTEIEWLSAADNAATTALNLSGNEIANYIVGNAGINVLDGGAGADFLYGLGGNDTYYVDNAGDQLFESIGNGFDAAYVSVSYALAAGQEIEWLSTVNNSAADAIDLTGNEFANYLVGNAGANVLDGKGGDDILIGNAGADTFAFTTALGAGNVDLIVGFEQGVDKIALDDALFTAIGGLGGLNPNAFVVGSAAADASDRIIYNSLTGQLFYDADGTGAGAAVQFATLSPGLTLTAGDFTVI